jgi:ABC-type sugar transport system substrate-binding protein
VGAVQAVRKAGMQGKIFVFGIDGTEQLAGFVLDPDNVLQSVTAQQPFVMGSMAVQAALDALDGKPVEKKVIVPVIGLGRDNPDAVKAFIEDLKKMQ